MMSNVRVSSGSPSLERMEARQPQPPPQPQPQPQPPPPSQSQQSPSEPPKPSACRSLFGPVDHRELARELRRHRREQEEASRARWNFDFQRHRPLQGRFQWQALRRQALPGFYSRGADDGDGGSSPSPSPSPPEGRRRERGDGGGGGGGGTPRAPGRETQEEEEEAALGAAGKEDLAGHKSPAAAQRKRPPGDDSFPPNKRANMTEEAISEGSPSASSVEQTPKKSSPRQRST